MTRTISGSFLILLLLPVQVTTSALSSSASSLDCSLSQDVTLLQYNSTTQAWDILSSISNPSKTTTSFLMKECSCSSSMDETTSSSNTMAMNEKRTTNSSTNNWDTNPTTTTTSISGFYCPVQFDSCMMSTDKEKDNKIVCFNATTPSTSSSTNNSNPNQSSSTFKWVSPLIIPLVVLLYIGLALPCWFTRSGIAAKHYAYGHLYYNLIRRNPEKCQELLEQDLIKAMEDDPTFVRMLLLQGVARERMLFLHGRSSGDDLMLAPKRLELKTKIYHTSPDEEGNSATTTTTPTTAIMPSTPSKGEEISNQENDSHKEEYDVEKNLETTGTGSTQKELKEMEQCYDNDPSDHHEKDNVEVLWGHAGVEVLHDTTIDTTLPNDEGDDEEDDRSYCEDDFDDDIEVQRKRREKNKVEQNTQDRNENASAGVEILWGTLNNTKVVEDEVDSLFLDDDENAVVCAICMSAVVEGDRVGDLICHHLFHVDCLKQWLKKKNECPMCSRKSIAQRKV